MASRIKGITVEIGGDTSGLEKSLSAVNNSIKKTQSQLRDVNNLLKLDPSNTILLAQKQELLQSAIGDTEKKLEALEQAQEDVTKAFERGDLGKDQYMAFQREVEETRGALNRYKADLSGLQSEQERLASNTERLNKLFAATGSSVEDYADVLGSRLVTAIRNGTASSDQLKTAVEKIGKAVTSGKADIKQLTDALDTVDDGQAVRNLINDLNDVCDAAQDAADDIGEIAQATKGAALMEAADQLSVVGDKIQDVGDKAVSVYAETEMAVSKVNAYFGETGEVAEASAEIVKNVYGSGVGQSMDAVAEAVIMVKKNLGDLGDTDLTNLTKQALTLEELYGIDMNETLRGVNSLMKQYGLTAQEAMDYIVRGTQNGLDKTNELGDNLSEYAGKFEQAGYSASEYFQLLQNGLQGGAYNLDKVNDAINEVTTRLADGTIGDSIDLYSQKTQSLFLAWQNGEATQKQVIDSIVADIGNCTSQQEALNMAAKAFGTMAEDGNLKFITSLTSVGETYDNVAGSAENLFSQTQTPMQEMEANTRKLQQALVPLGEKIVELANVVLPPLVAIITAVSEVFGMLPEPVQNFVVILGANRGFGGVLRGAEHLPASRDRHYCRSGGGHCRDHRYRQKLGSDYGMVREPVANSIPKTDGIMGRAGGLFYGDHPGSVPDLHQLFFCHPGLVERPVVTGIRVFHEYLERNPAESHCPAGGDNDYFFVGECEKYSAGDLVGYLRHCRRCLGATEKCDPCPGASADRFGDGKFLPACF